MHIFCTILAADLVSANFAVKQAFGNIGNSFNVPLYAITATDDSTPIRYCTAAELVNPNWQTLVNQLQLAFPTATIEIYDLTGISPIENRLTILELRKALPKTI